MSTKDLILARRIVAIIRLDDYDKAVEVARALLAGGVPVMEFTLTGAGALEAIAAVRKELGDAVCVGVGSVLHAEQATAAIDSGAQFVVTPALRRPVIAACVNRGTLTLCGGVTPTELLDAYEAGSELVKLFPARLGGPAYLKDVLAPLPFLKLVPTGGVGVENARAYIDAGAAALGIGGNLVPRAAVASGRFDQISEVARACVAAIS
ncbi:bifunctional 4-hydroxy-2-oxoglutarate aldolase/2-dehydro-3-deoxy-phosphogluconate aldolase [Oscillochloris sp. ZM17-4]|uniref:bifunctional 4-hydroxy-2-oxoglutarate aldolase/2-dehydro-3-deoxy-phosphogluconate aldolase n=1 Tax=Oscillochloris sp. ZM17-4 TaxID=2866714 RepID=UPI001C72BE56|nr:bifunctional 4-hydroxy-2-oxoglutarate aldolase/2-dehydro-3-deoxy-phosphogluconate aldolase [Oscillochloris sp. ZM17-4]MBX0328857.1 bifunctional 4-hydroxy-2-oxoglutarate aldolase/2-dehydro-3-deoxy-phosphogluconate aldolase [Oscillochloris sp. ZM17-4]